MSSPGNVIGDLQDDDFVDSMKEHCIFTRVFFGCNSASTTKRCLVTGAIVFEPADAPLSSNGPQSTQASSKDGDVRDDRALSDMCTGSSEPHCSHETFSDGQNETAKRVKYLAGPTVLPKVINHGASCPVKETFSKTIICRLVESSSGDVTYSSYLLKKPSELTRDGESEEDLLMCELSSLKNDSCKEVNVSKSVASPISQESFADKVLVVGPSNAREDKSAFSNPDESEKELGFPDLHLSNVPGSSKFTKDPRRLIQDEINHLLEATGWHSELRKRRNSRQRFLVYLSPNGKSFRKFPKVWQSLGQELFGKKYKFWQQTNGKHWTDIEQFSSDLSEALMRVKKIVDQSNFKKALADIWILLHPFVVVAIIDKKIGILRKRNVAAADRGRSVNNNTNCKALLSMDNLDTTGHKLAASRFCGSHLTLETESVVVDDDEEIDNDNRDPHACNVVPGDLLHNGNNVNLGGFDMNLGSSYQLYSPSEAPLQADLYEHSNCKVGNCPGLDNVNLLKEKHEHMSPSFITRHLLRDDEKALQRTGSLLCKETSKDGISVKKILQMKSRRKSEMKVSSLYRNEIVINSPGQREFSDSKEMMGDVRSPTEDSIIVNEHADFQDCNQVTTSMKPKQQNKVKTSNDQMEDDELLVSAVMENKYSICSDNDMSMNDGRPKCKRKLKSQGSRHKSQTQNAAKSRHLINGTYIPMGPRTVLSWLIDTGAVSLNDVIQCRDARYHITVKEGLVTRDGILCRCCNVVFPVSLFKTHSGVNQNHPFANLFLRNGESYTTRLLQAWSADYKTRKASMKPSQIEDLDNNDDTCGICGDGGDLICCDGCPSTFHQMCLATQDLPDGNWYCSSCTCRICGDLVSNSSSTLRGLECKQCETKYHEACLTEMGLDRVVDSATWFCGRNCKEVYLGLQAQIGVPRDISDGFSSILLKCIYNDQKIESPKRLALKAECNSMLAVGLSIMEECFSAMSDPRTGISMIPHMVYNCWSNFARMDFHGFYTVVLEKGDILTSVASIRIHGVTIAEMPMVATCSKYRRQGMCRRLMDAIEEMLISLKIEKLVVSALPDLVEIWTVGFGFQPLEDYEKESLSSLNLMVLPGTIFLKKLLYSCHNEEPKEYEKPGSVDDYSGGGHHKTISQQLNSYAAGREVGDDNPEYQLPNNDSKFITAGEDNERQLQKQFSKLCGCSPKSTVVRATAGAQRRVVAGAELQLWDVALGEQPQERSDEQLLEQSCSCEM